jgi:hypothetical protein
VKSKYPINVSDRTTALIVIVPFARDELNPRRVTINEIAPSTRVPRRVDPKTEEHHESCVPRVEKRSYTVKKTVKRGASQRVISRVVTARRQAANSLFRDVANVAQYAIARSWEKCHSPRLVSGSSAFLR